MADFNYGRLDLARRRRGLTKTTLAHRAGISTRSLTGYERGEKEPTQLTIARLADALDFPSSFFIGAELDEPPLDGSSFRALRTLTARQRDQALGSASLALRLSDWVDARFTLPLVDLPRLRGVDSETAAEAVRAAWGIGERPAPNMVHLLEAHGVRVFSLAEECREVDAFSFWRGSVPYIFLNTIKSAERSRMDAAHELGHLVLHWRGGPQGREAEKEAQAFGAAFLMPSGSIRAEAPRGGHLAQLLKAKRRWKVALSNFTYRMHSLGLLTDWQYRSLFVEMSKKGYRSNEPGGIPRETSKVLEQAFQLLREEGVSKAKIAQELALPPEEVNKVVFGLVLTPLEGGQAEQSQSDERPTLRLV